MSKVTTDILKLQKQLLPTGRAFSVSTDSVFEQLLLGLGGQKTQTINNTIGILDSVIADNSAFDENDAAAWEEALGIYASSTSTLEERIAAIYAKQQFPSNVKGRQHKSYLEYRLTQAGFECGIYEWSDIKDKLSAIQHSASTHHSTAVHHGAISIPAYSGIIANYLTQSQETQIPTSLQNLKNIFWICGTSGFDSFIDIPSAQMKKFRHIVLEVKPLHTVAYLRTSDLATWILADGTWSMSGEWINSALWT
ncbi:MAG: hypothetical protein H6Q17_564 [Bacteroidetes bacterium]|nr:hypothetical protein [Bacteroidota bacterium]